MTDTATMLTEEQQAELIQRFVKTKDQAASAKKSLDEEKARLVPFEEAKKAADGEHADARQELTDALGGPGAKFTTAVGTAALSKPKTTVVREVDMDALVEYLREEQPEVIERFMRDVAKTPKPRLTVKG